MLCCVFQHHTDSSNVKYYVNGKCTFSKSKFQRPTRSLECTPSHLTNTNANNKT